MLAGDGFRQDGLGDVGGAEGAEPDDEDAPRVVLQRADEADEQRHDGDHRRDEYDGSPPAALGSYSVVVCELMAAWQQCFDGWAKEWGLLIAYSRK